MKPWIGLSINIETEGGNTLYPHPLYYVERCYVDSLIAHGMNPVLLPVLDGIEDIQQYLERLDGLVLTGGGFLPLYTSASSLPGLTGTGKERYYFEQKLLHEALKMGMPILGICRGAQMINEVCGGTLQNISDDSGLCHHQEKLNIPREQPTHGLCIDPHSRFGRIIGKESVMVNSLHRQCIATVGKGLQAVGWSEKDQLIEVIEGKDHPWLIGVQFHPERLWKEEPCWSNLFESMKREALAYKGNRSYCKQLINQDYS